MKIFLSYGRESIADAEQLKDDLERRDHQVWLDRDRLAPGSDWETEIEQGLLWCDKVVLLMTPQSVRRRNLLDPESTDGFCLNELAKALHYQKRVVPIMLVWVPEGPPTSICRVQYLDMTDCVPFSRHSEKYAVRFQRLAAAIEQDALDYGGVQSRLRAALRPLDFELEIAQHIGRLVGRRWLASLIDKWLAEKDGKRVFWLVGKPGVGKSAVAVNLCHKRSDAFHMCIAGHEDKGDARRALLSIAYQLSTHLPNYFDRLTLIDPDEWKTPDALFDNLILAPLTTRSFPAPDRQVLLVIDALDEATRDGQNAFAELLARRARQLPAWFRVFVTSRPEFEVMAPLQDLEPVILDPESDRNKSDIRSYFKDHLHGLGHPGDDATVEMLVRKSGGVFLYATLVIDAIRAKEVSLNSLPELPAGMADWYRTGFARRYSNVETYSRLLRPVIDATIAQNAPMPLAVLRGALGISEREMLSRIDQLGSFFPVRQLSDGRETIAPVHKSLRDWLVERNPFTRTLVAGSYAAAPEEGARLLAEHGWRLYQDRTLNTSDYQSRFLVHNLIAIGDWKRASELLTDLDQFTMAVDEGRSHEWMRLWRALPRDYDPGEAYEKALDALTERHADRQHEARMAHRIGSFLRDMGHTRRAFPFLARSLEIRSQTGQESVELAMAIRELAELHRLEGRMSDALPLYQNAIGMCERVGEGKGAPVATLYHDLAEYYRTLRRYTDALSYNQLSLSLRETLNPPDHVGVANCLNDMGVLLWEEGVTDAALGYYERARLLFERSASAESPDLAACLHNIGQMLGMQADDRDLAHLTNALQILGGTYVSHHPSVQTCRRTLAAHLEWRARFAEALELREAVVENAKAGDPGHEGDDVVTDQSAFVRTKRRRDQVAQYVAPLHAMLRRAADTDPDFAELVRPPLDELRARLSSTHGDVADDTLPAGQDVSVAATKESIVEACFQLGAFLSDYGYHPVAVALLRAAVDAARSAGASTHATLLRALDRLVNSYTSLKRFKDAIDASRSRCNMLGGGSDGVTRAGITELTRLVTLYFDAGAYDLALVTSDECVAAARQRFGTDSSEASRIVRSTSGLLSRYGIALKNRKEAFDDAERFYRRALELTPDEGIVLGNLALLLSSAKGQHAEAGVLYQRALNATATDPIVTGNYAVFLHHVQRDFAQAEIYYLKAIELPPPDQNCRANYALLLIMLGRFAEAGPQLRKAWQIADGQHDRVSGRILFTKALLEALRGGNPAFYLGQLKFLMASNVGHGPWAIDGFRAWVLDKMPAEDVVFYLALVDAISSRESLMALSRESKWQSLVLVPLDQTWPADAPSAEVQAL